jgi:hypothetical protein
VQARALNAVPADLPALRALLRDTQPLTQYRPSGDERPWIMAERRLG